MSSTSTRRLSGILLAVTLIAAACSDDSDDSEDQSAPSDDPASATGALIDEAPEGDAFYQPPDPIPGEPGDVIWAREDGPIPGGTLHTVLYHSTSLQGDPVGVSGWIAVPEGDAPQDGRPVMAWGHGTLGVADQCAPTRQDDPTDDMPVLADLLERGFVVSASDYEGLGTPGLHPYVIGLSEAHSVLDSIRAAQRFTPTGAGETAMIFGHSQGGHAMAFATEQADDYAPELDIIGTIGSGAGVFNPDAGIVEFLLTSEFRGFMVIAVAAQAEAYGEDVAPYDRLLTPEGIEELAFLEEGCVGDILEHYDAIPPEDLFRLDDYDMTFTTGEDPNVLNTAGQEPANAPILLVHGRSDGTVPANAVTGYAETVCDQGGEIQLNFYDGEHRVMYAEEAVQQDVLDWIDDRLAGEEPPSVCGAVPTP